MNSKEAFQLVLNKIRNTSRWYEDELKLIQQDLEKLEKLENENKDLRKSIKSWNENAGNLLKENTKLKEALKFLCEELDIKLCYNNCYDNGMLFYEEYYLDYQSDIDSRTLHRITKEKYNLLEETLKNE